MMLCDVFIQLMDAEKGRKAIGGKVEIKLRIREPLTDKDVEILTQKWLVIEAFVVPSNRVSVFRLRLHRIAFLSDVKKHVSVPFMNANFRRIIATERCCFAQLLKVVHSVSDRRFFAPLRKGESYLVYTRKNAQVVAILMKTGLNNALLPTLFIVVNNIEQYCYTRFRLNNIVQHC